MNDGVQLDGRVLAVNALTVRQREEMYALMARYYEGVSRAQFDADLDGKRWVICVSDPDTGQIRGFSTQTLLDPPPGAGPMRILYSGDTIMDQQKRAANALTQWWGRLALALMDRYPEDERYWFLISKGYKTYRFLPVFFHEFYPRYDRPTPAWASRLIDGIAAGKFPDTYDRDAGVVRAPDTAGRLREGVAAITPQRLKDPHVRFFASANPGHARGDELCCIAPLTRENFKPAAYRAIGGTDAGLAIRL